MPDRFPAAHAASTPDPAAGEKAALILSDLLAELRTLDRYEQRALSRRNRATVAFDTVRVMEEADRRTGLAANGT